jgi:putative tricarboxylic transport membrane protein
MVLGLAVMGAYAINTSMVEVGIMLVMGFIGYMMKIFNVPREPMVLGLVLGPIAEGELARAMALVHGSLPDLLTGMLTDPLSLSIIALTVFSLYQGIKNSRKQKA